MLDVYVWLNHNQNYYNIEVNILIRKDNLINGNIKLVIQN